MASDTGIPALIIGGVALLGSIGAILKIIKKSDCWGIHIQTRTPPDTPNITLSGAPPSPINPHKNNIEPIYKEVEV
jgi:hypothetical protein